MKASSLITAPAPARQSQRASGSSSYRLPPSYTLDGVLLGMDVARRQRIIDRETVTVTPMTHQPTIWPHDVLIRVAWWKFWQMVKT